MRRLLVALSIVSGLLFSAAPAAAQAELKVGMLVKAAPGDQFFCTTEADVQKALKLRAQGGMSRFDLHKALYKFVCLALTESQIHRIVAITPGAIEFVNFASKADTPSLWTDRSAFIPYSPSQ